MDSMCLYYDKPASKWEEALPVGNGRLGAMVTSGLEKDVLYLNEDSIWSGSAVNRNNPDAQKYLGKIRDLLHQGKIPEAEKLSVMALSGTPNSQRSYETAGELTITFGHEDACERYRRELNLHTGSVVTSYRVGSTNYKREPWAFGDKESVYYDSICKAIETRYRLMPYIYSVAASVCREDAMFLRALVFAYGQDSDFRAGGSYYSDKTAGAEYRSHERRRDRKPGISRGRWCILFIYRCRRWLWV